MGKKAKIGKLIDRISIKMERVIYLLNIATYSVDDEFEKTILTEIAYYEAKRMARINQKILKYL